MRTTTESVPDVESTGCDAPALSQNSKNTSELIEICPYCFGIRSDRRSCDDRIPFGCSHAVPCRHPFHGELTLSDALPEKSESVASGDAVAEPVSGKAEEPSRFTPAEVVAHLRREHNLPIGLGEEALSFGEPWHAHDGILNYLELMNVSGERILLLNRGDVPEEFHRSYLRRIAACVNYCAGISTAALERETEPRAEHLAMIDELSRNSADFHADQDAKR